MSETKSDPVLSHFETGVRAAEELFAVMINDPGWDGQVSMGFAATFYQEIDRLLEEVKRGD